MFAFTGHGFLRLNLNQLDTLRIVDTQCMRRIGSSGNVARRPPGGFQRLQSDFGAFLLEDSPCDVVDRDAIFADDQRIRLPQMLGPEAGAAFIYEVIASPMVSLIF